jgi:hypothetical protein
MEAVMRASTLAETRGFLKALVETGGDRILGFTGLGVGAGEVLSSVQIAMVAGLPYTALRDAILTPRPLWKVLFRCSPPYLRCQDLLMTELDKDEQFYRSRLMARVTNRPECRSQQYRVF